jgi:hypothetical protein
MSVPRLTPEQKLRAAVAVLCDHIDQQIVANLYGTNIGRVNESCQVVRKALGFPRANGKKPPSPYEDDVV